MSILLILALSAAGQTAPADWTCEAALFADDTCDCGCGAVDDDCASASADVCARDNCPQGQVAWQDNNASCMDEGGCAAAPPALTVAVLALLFARRRGRVSARVGDGARARAHQPAR